jgi:hypothetical protein
MEISMANLKGDIKLFDKANHQVASATKVVYTKNKVNGEPFPRSYNLTIYGVDLTEVNALPAVFDIVAVDEDGVMQSRTCILDCSVKGELEGYVIAVATAPDEHLTEAATQLTGIPSIP